MSERLFANTLPVTIMSSGERGFARASSRTGNSLPKWPVVLLRVNAAVDRRAESPKRLAGLRSAVESWWSNSISRRSDTSQSRFRPVDWFCVRQASWPVAMEKSLLDEFSA